MLRMDSARRALYLRQLGIERWRLRAAEGAPAIAEAPAITRSPVAAAEPPRTAPAAADDGPPLRALPPTAAAPHPDFASDAVAAPAPPPHDIVPMPTDWDGLRAVVKDCQACKLCQTRTQTVFGVGPTDAPLMVIGEGPGADEDARGEPFVGRAGKLLDEMLRAIGCSRGDNTFIANVVKCRPPGNRDPEADEVHACQPYLDQQIRLIRPRLIVGLGRVAAQRLLATNLPMSKLRGSLHHYGADATPLLLTYHPAYLLRSPREKAKAWDDLKRIHRFLHAPGSAA